MEIVNHVRDFRLEKGWTQEELAERAGVSRQSVISIERGKYIPSLTLALKFARLFDCPSDILFQLNE